MFMNNKFSDKVKSEYTYHNLKPVYNKTLLRLLRWLRKSLSELVGGFVKGHGFS